MPETKKFDASSKASAHPHEPIQSPADPVEASTAGDGMPHAETAAQPEAEESNHEKPLEAADEESIGAFAESVVSGLELAGFELEDGAETSDGGQASAAKPSEPEEAFFAGWGGPEGKDELQSSSGDPSFAGQRSLSEIGIAASLHTGSFADDLSNKHDELADAVQSALLSVYGDPSSRTNDSTFEEASLSSAAYASAQTGAQLSPQEVILNYFDYSPPSGRFSPNGTGLEYATQAYFRGQGTRHWDGSSYEGPPTYAVPVAAGSAGAMGGAVKDRKSGRLIGAAGIGLVAGLAIAASWAYVTLNGTQIANGSASAGVEDAGYGPSLFGGAEGEKLSSSATADSQAEIAARDVVATAGQPAPLAISVKARQLSDQALVNISGLPAGTHLNAGIDAGDGSWLLPPRRLNGLTINLPDGAPRTVALEVQLLDGIARTPLSEKRQFTVRLNAAKPDPASYAAMNQGPALADTASSEAQKPEPGAAKTSTFNTEILATAPQKSAAAQSLESVFRTQTVTTQPSQQPSFQTALVPSLHNNGSTAESGVRNVPQQAVSKAEVEDLIREGDK
ncbi:MAG TPA: hypothetical protein VE986_02705, partial [Hyphomicrobiales bacterium]|nr:hypothetical protein [Hyphomicrobiales bacterium]